MFGNRKASGKEQRQAAELGQQMNAKLRMAKLEFEAREFESKSNDGLVAVVVSGRRDIKSLSINMSVDNENKASFESLLTSVINQALSIVRDANIQLTEDVKKSFTKEMGAKGRSR